MDGIEQEMGDKLLVLHVNVQEQAGRELASIYDLEYTPTFIFFNAKGNEVWRTIGEIDPQRVRTSLSQ